MRGHTGAGLANQLVIRECVARSGESELGVVKYKDIHVCVTTLVNSSTLPPCLCVSQGPQVVEIARMESLIS